jgi:hypothetical protein
MVYFYTFTFILPISGKIITDRPFSQFFIVPYGLRTNQYIGEKYDRTPNHRRPIPNAQIQHSFHPAMRRNNLPELDQVQKRSTDKGD